jgi:hypothetical protein
MDVHSTGRGTQHWRTGVEYTESYLSLQRNQYTYVKPSYPQERTRGNQPRFLPTANKQPFLRHHCKRYLNCFCWKTLAPYLGPWIN